MPGFEKTVYFQQFLLGGLRVNYFFDTEHYFQYIFSYYLFEPL